MRTLARNVLVTSSRKCFIMSYIERVFTNEVVWHNGLVGSKILGVFPLMCSARNLFTWFPISLGSN